MSNAKQRPFSWQVLLFDVNTDKLRHYDALNWLQKFVKQLKKKKLTKEAFAEKLKRQLMHRFWSRSQYEMLIMVSNGRVLATPLICRSDVLSVDITDESTLNWPLFTEKMLAEKAYNGVAKIDVWDQLEFRFNQLVDFCWNYRHKYQRIANV